MPGKIPSLILRVIPEGSSDVISKENSDGRTMGGTHKRAPGGMLVEDPG